MYDLVALHEQETVQDLAGKDLDQVSVDALEASRLEPFIKVCSKQLKRDAQVPAELEIVEHMDAVVRIVVIGKTDLVQDLHLNLALLFKSGQQSLEHACASVPLFVSNNL